MAKKATAEAAVETVPEAAEAVEEAPVKKKAAAPEAVKESKKFPIDNLAKNARKLFGVSSCIFAGATAGITGEYSVEEMKDIIDKWCGKEAR